MLLVAFAARRTIEHVYFRNTYRFGALCALLLATTAAAAPLRIVATTSLIADVARAVGGSGVEVAELIPRAVDPHAYEPTPRDMAQLQKSDVVFANGLGLETFLDRVLAAGGATQADKLVVVSSGRAPRTGEPLEEEIHGGHDHGETDPHVWFDPTWVQRWAENIATTLAARDPAHADAYQQRASAYGEQLAELDAWMREQFDSVPAAQRVIVTEHDEFGYLADRYGITVVGTLLPNFNSLTESSARALVALQKQMQTNAARVVVVSFSANSALAERLARDTGARVVRLYTHSLGPAGSETADYLGFMRFTTRTLTEALREAPQ